MMKTLTVEKSRTSARDWSGRILLTALSTLLLWPPAPTTAAIEGETPVLSRENNTFKLDGHPISRFGLRAVNTLQDDARSDSLISALNDLKAYGMQTVVVGMQGGRATQGGNSAYNAYNPDGSIKPAFANRLKTILEAAAERKMVVVINCFYRGRDQELTDAGAVRAAVRNTLELIKPWRHAWVAVINEPGHGGFDHEILKTREGWRELYQLAKSVDPERIVYVAHVEGANDGFLCDTWGRNGIGTDMPGGSVCIEYTRGDHYHTPGRFDHRDGPYGTDANYRRRVVRNLETTYNNESYWFWHTAWHQKADEPGWPRFDKGGAGTASDPGVAFAWNRMRDLSGATQQNVFIGQRDASGSRSQGPNRLDAIQFTAGTTFTAKAMNARLDSCSDGGSIRLAIYADDNGQPGAVLASTAEFDARPGLNSAELAEPVDIKAGETYWLAAWHRSDSLRWVAQEEEGIRRRGRLTYTATGSFPDGARLTETDAVTYAIYATETPAPASPSARRVEPVPLEFTMPPKQVGQWERFEASVRNKKSYNDPYRDVTLEVTYTRPDGSTIEFWGFYEGEDVWRIRCLPDQTGQWQYRARFLDGSPGLEGTFECVPSETPGLIIQDETNPMWFGFKGGEPVLIRGFHVGDRFFAANWPEEERARFLDWTNRQGYNLLSIGSHYLNRDVDGRGRCWDTPRLWPLDGAEYRRMEVILDDLAERRIIVYPFGGFFGRNSDFPQSFEEQVLYIKYTLARLGSYWNILLNVGGPEPLLRGSPYFSFEEVNRLGEEIQRWNVFGHLLTVHNATGDDPFKDQDWLTFGTLQGPKTGDLQRLSAGLLKNHHPAKPLLAQETLWTGNQFHIRSLGNRDYTDDEVRKNTWVIHMSAAALVFGDMGGGNSSAGFTGSMDPAEAAQDRHDIVRRVWELAEEFAFHRMSPRQDLTDTGYCLAEPGVQYLVYLPSPGTVNLKIEGGPYQVEWINPRDPSDRRQDGQTLDGRLTSPTEGDDWLAHLSK